MQTCREKKPHSFLYRSLNNRCQHESRVTTRGMGTFKHNLQRVRKFGFTSIWSEPTCRNFPSQATFCWRRQPEPCLSPEADERAKEREGSDFGWGHRDHGDPTAQGSYAGQKTPFVTRCLPRGLSSAKAASSVVGSPRVQALSKRSNVTADNSAQRSNNEDSSITKGTSFEQNLIFKNFFSDSSTQRIEEQT